MSLVPIIYRARGPAIGPQPAKRTPPEIPPLDRAALLAAPESFWGDLGSIFGRSEKHVLGASHRNDLDDHKSRPWAAQCSKKDPKNMFSVSLVASFFGLFTKWQKRVWCSQANRFNGFWPLKTSHLLIKTSMCFHVFSKPLPGTGFGGSQCRQFGHHFRPQRFQKSMTPSCREWPFREPCCHETIVITVSLGHRGFFKYNLSMEIGWFSVVVAFRCAMCYTTILSFVLIKHR